MQEDVHMPCKEEEKAQTNGEHYSTSVQDQNFPKLKGKANPKLTSQPSKGGLIQRLCEDVGKLFFRAHMDQIYVSLLIVIT